MFVVLDVLDEQLLELAFVPDDRVVQQFVTHGANPALRERVRHRRTRWGRDRGHTNRFEHGVERSGVLAGPVVNDEPERLVDGHEEVAGSLRGPRSCRVRRDPANVYPTRADLDEEQHMEPAQGRGVDAQEVRGDDPFGL